MPTARELLEQADALMRRNRAADTSIPVLTDIVEPDLPPRSGPSTRERAGDPWRGQRAPEEPPKPAKSARSAAEPQMPAPRAAPASEPPVLTESVPEPELKKSAAQQEAEQGDPSLWLGPDTIDPSLNSITGPAPDTVAVVPPVTLRATPEAPAEPANALDDPDPTITRTVRAAGSAQTPPPAHSTPAPSVDAVEPAGVEPAAAEGFSATDEEHWRALAEQISMQVLQRIDLFTDTGLKAQLAAHLQPIVARASKELVEAINNHVGQLVRSYIAEAIEREINEWRGRQH